MEKLIITVAITGGASPERNPFLPKTPEHQVKATLEAYQAGASVVHIHARNPETGKGEHKAQWFEEAVVPIREQRDIINRDCSEKKWKIVFKGRMKAGYKTLSSPFWP